MTEARARPHTGPPVTASRRHHLVIRRIGMPARVASLSILPSPSRLPSPLPRLRPPRPRLRRTPPHPRPRPATVTKEAAPPAAMTKASLPEAATGVFTSTPTRSLPDHSGRVHSVVDATKASPPVATTVTCDVPARGHRRGLPPQAAPTGHPPRNSLSPSQCRRDCVPQQGTPPYPHGYRHWNGSRADVATAATGMTVVSSGTDVASTSGAAVVESVLDGHRCRRVGCPIGEPPLLRPLLTWRRPRGALISAVVLRQSSAVRLWRLLVRRRTREAVCAGQ